MQCDTAQPFDDEKDHHLGIHRTCMPCLFSGFGYPFNHFRFSIHFRFNARQFRRHELRMSIDINTAYNVPCSNAPIAWFQRVTGPMHNSSHTLHKWSTWNAADMLHAALALIVKSTEFLDASRRQLKGKRRRWLHHEMFICQTRPEIPQPPQKWLKGSLYPRLG